MSLVVMVWLLFVAVIVQPRDSDGSRIDAGILFQTSGDRGKGKGKGKGLGTCYSAAYMSRLEQQRFTISEVGADWHELVIGA